MPPWLITAGAALGALGAGVSIWTAAIGPATGLAADRAAVMAKLAEHDRRLELLERHQEEFARDVRTKLDGQTDSTSACRVAITAVQGQLALLIERTEKSKR